MQEHSGQTEKEKEYYGDLRNYSNIKIQHKALESRKKLMQQWEHRQGRLIWQDNALLPNHNPAGTMLRTSNKIQNIANKYPYTIQDLMSLYPGKFGGKPNTRLEWNDDARFPGHSNLTAGAEIDARLESEYSETGERPNEADKQWHQYELMTEFPGMFEVYTTRHSQQGAPQAGHPVAATLATAHAGQYTGDQGGGHLATSFVTYARALLAYIRVGEHLIDSLKREPLEQETTAVALFSTSHSDLDQLVHKVDRTLSDFTRLARANPYYLSAVTGPEFPLAQIQNILKSAKALDGPVPNVSDMWTDSAKYKHSFNDLSSLLRQAAEDQHHKSAGPNSSYTQANTACHFLMSAVNDLRNYIVHILQSTGFKSERRNIKRELALKHKFHIQTQNASPLLNVHRQSATHDTHRAMPAAAQDKITPDGTRMLQALQEETQYDDILNELLVAHNDDSTSTLNGMGIHDPDMINKLEHEWDDRSVTFFKTLKNALIDLAN